MTGFGSRASALLCAFTLCALAACGGGGGGGSGGGGGGGDAPPTVTTSLTAFDFKGFTAPNTSANAQSVQFTVVSGTGPYYANIVFDVPALFVAPQFVSIDGSNAAWVVQPAPTVTTVTTGRIELQLCSDLNCAHVAWRRSLTYSLQQFAVDATTLQMTAWEGTPADPQTLAIAPADTAGLLSVTATVDGTGAGWLAAGHVADGRVVVTADTTGLAPQTLSGHVRVGFVGLATGPWVDTPVSLSVGSGFVMPAQPAFTFDQQAPVLQSGTLPIAFHGTLAPAWTATSDAAWLVLDDPAGAGAATVHFQVDAAQMATTSNWQTSIAHVTLHADGLTDMVVPVTLARQVPEVYLVSPAVVPAGRAAHLHVFGRGFAQPGSAAAFQWGGNTVQAVRVISDREAWVDLAAPAAGAAGLSVANAAGVATLGARVTAVDTTAAAVGAFVSSPGVKGAAVLDEARQAVYVVDIAAGRLLRFQRQGDTWVKTPFPLDQAGAIAMSPDGTTLYATSGLTKLVAIDLETLRATASYWLPATMGDAIAPPSYAGVRIPFTNDGLAWFIGGTQWASPVAFDLVTHGYLQPLSSLAGLQYHPVPFATPDGSRLYLLQWGLSPMQPLSVFGIGNGSFTGLPTQAPDIEMPQFSQDGNLLVSSQRGLYDAQGNPVGSLPGSNIITAVPSPDGQRIFQMPVDATSYYRCASQMNVYDSSAVGPNGPPLSPIGQLDLPGQADDCYTNPWDSSLLVDAAGQTVYWVGNQGFAVIPVPASLQPAAGARRGANTVMKLAPARRSQ